jgi:hypothetical protein
MGVKTPGTLGDEGRERSLSLRPPKTPNSTSAKNANNSTASFPFLSLREKAELRGIVERDDRFAMLLEESTNEGMRRMLHNPKKPQGAKGEGATRI